MAAPSITTAPPSPVFVLSGEYYEVIVIVSVEVNADYDTAADLESDAVFVLSFKNAVVGALQGSFQYVTVDHVTIGAITALAEEGVRSMRRRSLLTSSFNVEFDIALASEDGETVSYTEAGESSTTAIDVGDISSTVRGVLENADDDFSSIELQSGMATASTFAATEEVSVIVVATSQADDALDDEDNVIDNETDGSSEGGGGGGLKLAAILGIVVGTLAVVAAAGVYFVKIGVIGNHEKSGSANQGLQLGHKR
jgi:hypothetical protein